MRNIFKHRVICYLACIGLLLPLQNITAAPAHGSFVATKACAAYVSKKNLTNPDQYQLTVNDRFEILEATGSGKSAWLRIRLTNAQPNARWVKADCGTADLNATTAGSGGSADAKPVAANQCEIANNGDSYVLAVSWQPAFCVTHQDKPECKITDKNAYQASHFTLHGLWPNQVTQCGTHYGYCGAVKTQPAQFCDYPSVGLTATVQDELGIVMPSVAAGSCLERHEWYKHGTCQTQWNADGYFETAIALTKQFNDSGVAAFIAEHVGESVKQTDFIAKVDSVLGNDAHERLHLTCKNGKLVDIYIDLPSKLETTQKLSDLLAQAKPTGNGFSSNCNDRFGVQALGRMQ